jgi:hypothetical protein
VNGPQVLPLLTLTLGIIGTITGLVAVNLNRKQMEGVGAAIVEMPHGVSIDFPVPPSGEARTKFTNSGQVIAHQVHRSFSLVLKSNGQSISERKIFATDEAIPAILQTSVTARPDFVHPFNLSPQEYKQVTESDAYFAAEGSLSYENGFGTRVELPFCYADVSGTKFGRWTGACEDAQLELREEDGSVVDLVCRATIFVPRPNPSRKFAIQFEPRRSKIE